MNDKVAGVKGIIRGVLNSSRRQRQDQKRELSLDIVWHKYLYLSQTILIYSHGKVIKWKDYTMKIF